MVFTDVSRPDGEAMGGTSVSDVKGRTCLKMEGER